MSEFTEAMAQVAAGVAVVTVREARDDVGATVNTFTSVSLDPPLVMISIAMTSYVNEVLLRQDLWAASLLSGGQAVIASRFATPGRPSARLLVAGTPHHRGPATEALIVEGGVTAIEAETTQVVATGDHTLYVARVLAVDYIDPSAIPLVRFRGRYRPVPV
jgi:flavin reductase (DIM6/NTAB) family NADH-FMN oxidoreductase RutF